MTSRIAQKAASLSASQRRVVAGDRVLAIGHRLILQDGRCDTLAALRRLGIIEDSRFGSTTFTETGLAVRTLLQKGTSHE